MSTIEAIEADILKKSEIAIFNTREKIYSVIDKNLRVFYGEYSPIMYKRTSQLLHSLVRTGGGLYAEVYFDSGALSYTTGTWSGAKVLDVSMGGSHGGYVGGTPVWGASMAELGDIVALIVKELKAAGLSVH